VKHPVLNWVTVKVMDHFIPSPRHESYSSSLELKATGSESHSRKAEMVHVHVLESDEQIQVRKDELVKPIEYDAEQISNLSDVNGLHMASMLLILKSRFEKGHIYVSALLRIIWTEQWF
jgi:hypothetical protein